MGLLRRVLGEGARVMQETLETFGFLWGMVAELVDPSPQIPGQPPELPAEPLAEPGGSPSAGTES